MEYYNGIIYLYNIINKNFFLIIELTLDISDITARKS